MSLHEDLCDPARGAASRGVCVPNRSDACVARKVSAASALGHWAITVCTDLFEEA